MKQGLLVYNYKSQKVRPFSKLETFQLFLGNQGP